MVVVIFRQQVKRRMVKICGQDEVQEGQEEEDEKDGAGADVEDHGDPGGHVQRGRRQQQGGLHLQPAGL